MPTAAEESIDFDEEDAYTLPELGEFFSDEAVSAGNVEVSGDLHEYDCETDTCQTPNCLGEVEQCGRGRVNEGMFIIQLNEYPIFNSHYSCRRLIMTTERCEANLISILYFVL